MTPQEADHISNSQYIAQWIISIEEVYQIVAREYGEEYATRGYKRQVENLLEQVIKARIENYITTKKFIEALELIKPCLKDEEKRKIEEQTQPIIKVGYEVGGLLIPDNIDKLPVLTAPQKAYKTPRTIDLRDYCLPPKNQHQNPWCAAYAAAGFAANVLWRKTDIPCDIDAEAVYRYAKKIDGKGNESGTTLIAALEGVIEGKYFDKTQVSPKILRSTEQVKYAIHKFGCCLLGMMVTPEWYRCNKKKSTITGGQGEKGIGGHAVLACGYNDDGVIIQNSWGEEWGSYGFGMVVWEEFGKEFLHGAVLDNCLYEMRVNK